MWLRGTDPFYALRGMLLLFGASPYKVAPLPLQEAAQFVSVSCWFLGTAPQRERDSAEQADAEQCERGGLRHRIRTTYQLKRDRWSDIPVGDIVKCDLNNCAIAKGRSD
jgi:hypothetical protein